MLEGHLHFTQGIRTIRRCRGPSHVILMHMGTPSKFVLKCYATEIGIDMACAAAFHWISCALLRRVGVPILKRKLLLLFFFAHPVRQKQELKADFHSALADLVRYLRGFAQLLQSAQTIMQRSKPRSFSLGRYLVATLLLNHNKEQVSMANENCEPCAYKIE